MTSVTLEITVNGDSVSVPDGATVSALLAQLELAGDRVAVERNRSIVSRTLWDSTILQAGDVLEVVHFVGGG